MKRPSRTKNPVASTRCISGKRAFANEELAESALMEAHQRNYYKPHEGPVNFYQCEECGQFHFTSKGAVHPHLEKLKKSGQLNSSREADFWDNRLRKK